MDLYDRIKLLVRQHDTTIESMLNNAGGISLNTYNAWKKRNVYPRADEALNIAKQLNVSVEYLLTGESSASAYSPRVKAIADACTRASDLELAMIEKILSLPVEGKILFFPKKNRPEIY